MGLSIEVGILGDLIENDDEGFDYFQEQFDAINDELARLKLPAHHEPHNIKDILGFDMWSYSGLHSLRRLAAHIAETGKLPEPSSDDPSNDPVLVKFYTDEVPRGIKFQHLIVHSDADGYYLPVDFAEVIETNSDAEIAGGLIGSSQRLLAECEEIAAKIGLPTDLDPESDEVWDAADAQGEAASGWQRYGIESHTCLRLIAAARHSIANKAAIVFN